MGIAQHFRFTYANAFHTSCQSGLNARHCIFKYHAVVRLTLEQGGTFQKHLRIRFGAGHLSAIHNRIKEVMDVQLFQDQNGILAGGAYCRTDAL